MVIARAMSGVRRRLRALRGRSVEDLPAGAAHYRAFVGPPDQYDLMGASQFALLVALGLRGRHRLLDFGCGSLRAGRLLIPYLDSGNYHGLEPNAWLVAEGFRNELGEDLRVIKQPSFHAFDDFRADRCGTGFDFIMAQSIFSHAGPGLTATALKSFAAALHSRGLAVMTFVHAPASVTVDPVDGWTYPDVVAYPPNRVQALLRAAGLHGRPIPWFHPRQTWYVAARARSRLPPIEHDRYLRGAILGQPDWKGSLGG
jgi:SAM-dependent methyltransferase